MTGGIKKSRIPRRVMRSASPLHIIQAQSRPRSRLNRSWSTGRQGQSRCLPKHYSRIPLPIRAKAAMAEMVKEETLQQRARVLLQKDGDQQKKKVNSQGPAKDAGGSLTETETKKLSNASEMAFRAMLQKTSMTSSLRGNRTIGRKVPSAHIRTGGMPFVPSLDSNFKWQSGQQVRKKIQQKHQRQIEQLMTVRQEQQLRKQQEFKDKMEKMMQERQDRLEKKEQELKKGQRKKQEEPGQKTKKLAQQDQEPEKEHQEDPDQKPEQEVEKKKLLEQLEPLKLLPRPSISLIPQPTIFNLFKEIYATTPGKEKESSDPEAESESESDGESGCKSVPELLRFWCCDKRFINIPSELLFSFSDEMRLRQDVSDAPMELRTISSSTLMKVVFWMKRHREENEKGGDKGGDWMKEKVSFNPNEIVPKESSEENLSGGAQEEPENTESNGVSKPENDNPTGIIENIAENATGTDTANWEERLMGGELTGLVELILAAHYLGIDTLTSHAINYFNDLMDERSRSEMLMMLKISDCLTEVRHSMEKHRPLLSEIMGDQAVTSPYSLTPSSSSHSRPALSSTPYSTCSTTTSISTNSLSASTIDEDPDEAALEEAEKKDGTSDGNSNTDSPKKPHSLPRPNPKF